MGLELAVEEQPATGTANLSPVAAPSATGNTIVRVRDLRKVFPRKKVNPNPSFWSRFLPRRPQPAEQFVAVDGVSFDIHEGEIFGLLGPNGAGKTTAIRMLSTWLEPSGGTATVNGYQLATQASLVRQSL